MSFELQPTLSGDLVALHPLAEDDFDVLFSVARDPLIWEQHPDRERYTEARFRVFFRVAMESGGALLAIERATGRVIGSSRYHRYSAALREIEIGWTFLAREFWGGRYNGEMKRLMLEHAFRWVDRVLFYIGPENLRSQWAVEKIGAVPAGTGIDATGSDSSIFAITREAYFRT